MAGRPNRRGCGNAHHLDFPPDYVPEGWIVINEINEDGMEERYIKVATNETFYTREDMLRYVAYERSANRPAPAINALYPLPARASAPAPARAPAPSTAIVLALPAAPAYGGGEPRQA